MRNIPIAGYDITEAKPVGGVFHVAGFIRSANDIILIEWEVDNASGSTLCEAWAGQYEIDCLIRAGYRVLQISLHQRRV
jgi:hypothetical protein